MNNKLLKTKFLIILISYVMVVSGWILPVSGSSVSVSPDEFISAEGTKLFLNGKEYREIGFNKYDLFGQSVLCDEKNWQEKNKKLVENVLTDLHKHDFKIIRTMACPYLPIDYERYFFEKDTDMQEAKRKIFFQRFDRLLDLCDEYDIKVVLSLIWWDAAFADLGGHSIHEGVTNPKSNARVKLHEYISKIVSRYKNRTTVAMWQELGNEWNLSVDLQSKDGVVRDYGKKFCPSVIVRDRRNNFNSEEMAKLVADLGKLIKSIDRNHLVTTGYASPRPAAMHLLEAVKQGKAIDWTCDSYDQTRDYIRLIHPEPIDIISIHYYDDAMKCFGGQFGNTSNISKFKCVADQIGKPVVIGEIGLYKGMGPEDEDYRFSKSHSYIQGCLDQIVKNKYPISLYWTYADSVAERGESNWSLEYGKTDDVLKMIEKANRDIKK